jgi:uncharacterized membrane protein
MQGVLELLKGWRLHPVVDHFTVALILVAILADLLASLLPLRLWLRNMAVTLMVLGALAAIGSKFTGGWEAERIWDTLSQSSKDALQWHAQVGSYLAPILSALAVWRVGLQFIGFLSRTRFIYLIVAVVAGGAILYQGDLGGDLVYEYGVGTKTIEQAAPSAAPSPGAAEVPNPIPTVFVPPPMPAAPTSASSPAPAATTSGAAPAPPVEVPPVLIPSPAVASPTPSPEPGTPGSKSTNL